MEVEEILERIEDNNNDNCENVLIESLRLLKDEHSQQLTVKQFLEFVLSTIEDPDNETIIDEYIENLKK